jgi:hypothetical protein
MMHNIIFDIVVSLWNFINVNCINWSGKALGYNVTGNNFMMRYHILFSKNEYWHFMYNFLSDSVICDHINYDLKTLYDIVRFISLVPKLIFVWRCRVFGS